MPDRWFAGKTFILRCDAATLLDDDATLVEDIAILCEAGVAPVIVAPDSSSARALVLRINRSENRAVGVSGADGALLPRGANGVGNVQPEVLTALLSAGFVPIVEPLAFAPFPASEECVEADDVARAIGVAMHAARALFFHRSGSIADPQTNIPIAELTAAEALTLADDLRVPADVRRTMRAAARGVRAGIGAAEIFDGRIAHAAVIELLTEQHLGTRVVGGVVLAA
ncbi:MAG TPA: hypothetical protein VMV73_05900 [Candidatus Dormibacteraeota bacterium]|nr:hypothetical protein [Candidatus Dormibacteraeota bacterium]